MFAVRCFKETSKKSILTSICVSVCTFGRVVSFESFLIHNMTIQLHIIYALASTSIVNITEYRTFNLKYDIYNTRIL